jgi:hypothetical protein
VHRPSVQQLSTESQKTSINPGLQSNPRLNPSPLTPQTHQTESRDAKLQPGGAGGRPPVRPGQGAGERRWGGVGGWGWPMGAPGARATRRGERQGAPGSGASAHVSRRISGVPRAKHACAHRVAGLNARACSRPIFPTPHREHRVLWWRELRDARPHAGALSGRLLKCLLRQRSPFPGAFPPVLTLPCLTFRSFGYWGGIGQVTLFHHPIPNPQTAQRLDRVVSNYSSLITSSARLDLFTSFYRCD